MSESNCPPSPAQNGVTREQRDAQKAAEREQQAIAAFKRQFEPEPAGVSAQERALREAAHDLSPVAVRNALMFAGCDPGKGLGGVPPAKMSAVSAYLRSSFRITLST